MSAKTETASLPSDAMGPLRRPARHADDNTPCIRQWKSDGLRRTVTLKHALSVLTQKTKITRERALESLLAGYSLETDVSIYWLE